MFRSRKSEIIIDIMAFYAVYRGKTPGIYTDWDEAAEQVNGFPGAVYKKYKSFEQAKHFVDNGTESWKDLLSSGSGLRKSSIFRSLKMEDVPHTRDQLSSQLSSQLSVSTPIPYCDPKAKFIICDTETTPAMESASTDDLRSLMCKYYKLYDDSGNLYVYTDGSSVGNGHKRTGGYGVFFSHCAIPYISERMVNCKIASGAAEVSAIREALQYIVSNRELILSLTNGNIIIWYDSTYASGVVQGELVAHTNLEIVKEARDLLKECRDLVHFKHVYSHTGKGDLHSIGNEIADRLAKKKHNPSNEI